MKKILYVAVISIFIVLGFSSCNLFGSLFTTELKITNGTSFELDFVSWSDVDYGPSSVYDYVLFSYQPGFFPGDYQTKDVDPDTDYVYFYFTTSAYGYRTYYSVTVDRFESESFTLYDYTQVVATSADAQPLTLKELMESMAVPE